MTTVDGQLLFVEFLDIADDDGLFGGIDILSTLESASKGVADEQTHGNGCVATASQEVGLILLKHHILDIVERVAALILTQKGVEALVVVGSLAPALGSDEVVVGHDTALRRFGILGGLERIEGLFSLVGLA